MRRWIAELDRILRGESTRGPESGDGALRFPVGGLLLILLLLALFYGFCMGWYALVNHAEPNYEQLLASTLKVPALFGLTFLVTFPSLYVFNSLVGSRLGIGSVFRLLVAALAVTLAVLASLGPITAFFSVTTTSYPFMILLNVVMFGISGTLGLMFLLRTLDRLTARRAVRPAVTATEGKGESTPTPDAPLKTEEPTDSTEEPVSAELLERPTARSLRESRTSAFQVRTVFRVWVVVFVVVAAQMSWVLRPLIGDPDRTFSWFRERESNFVEGFVEALRTLLSLPP